MASILVIEDDPMLRRMIRAQAEREGHQVFEGSNGALGVKVFEERPIDLVITDIFMPVQEGIETIIELRRKSQDVKIIAISGGGRLQSVDYLELAGKVGADRILKKPISRETLQQTINELLQ